MRVGRGSSLIPLFLDLKGKITVVYGAGPVGLRKAAYLARETRVTLVDRRPVEVPEGVTLRVGDALRNLDLIEISDIVVAATGDRVTDETICQMAKVAGKLFNRADALGNFLIPSLVERRNFAVAISTLGRSPGMSRHVKEVVETSLPAVLEDMVDLTESLREELKMTVPDARDREGRIRRLLDDPAIWEALGLEPTKAYELARGKVLE